MKFCGLLNVSKPPDVTSRKVVDLVARLVRPAKAGHAGTLDPLATGVLVVCVGPATRLIEYVQRLPKRYRATFLLGRYSPTEDVEGEVVELPNPPVPSLPEVVEAAAKLTGEILQRPPAFSALKVQGRRAYDLARKGQAVDLQPRPVTVYSLTVVEYDYPRLVLDVECTGGTYVRSLGRDLADSLGSAAVMAELVRTAIGAFRIEDALNPQGLTEERLVAHLLPPLRAVETLPHVVLSTELAARLRRGMRIRRAELEPADRQLRDGSHDAVEVEAPQKTDWCTSRDLRGPQSQQRWYVSSVLQNAELAVIDPNGALVGVGTLDGDDLRPVINMP
ncbi:MAG: tRNA pseudouridine(55) synthase TruB [Planctomycetota bacterium]